MKAYEVLRSLFQFGGIVTFPINLTRYIIEGINSTLKPENKVKIKDLQKRIVKSAQITSSSRPGYYTSTGFTIVPDKRNGAQNLKTLCLKTMQAMINDNYEYDFAGLTNYRKRINRIPAILKKSQRFYSFAKNYAHNKSFSIKNTLTSLKGSCQEFSELLAIILSTQNERKGIQKITRNSSIQDLLNKDEKSFLDTLPSDKKIKLIYGDLENLSTGDSDSHVLIGISYTNPANHKKEEKIIDPALILSGPDTMSRMSALSDFCFVDSDIYRQNLSNIYTSAFSPTYELEIKSSPKTSIESVYRALTLPIKVDKNGEANEDYYTIKTRTF